MLVNSMQSLHMVGNENIFLLVFQRLKIYVLTYLRVFVFNLSNILSCNTFLFILILEHMVNIDFFSKGSEYFIVRF